MAHMSDTELCDRLTSEASGETLVTRRCLLDEHRRRIAALEEESRNVVQIRHAAAMELAEVRHLNEIEMMMFRLVDDVSQIK